jgi:hypothetical protein
MRAKRGPPSHRQLGGPSGSTWPPGGCTVAEHTPTAASVRPTGSGLKTSLDLQHHTPAAEGLARPASGVKLAERVGNLAFAETYGGGDFLKRVVLLGVGDEMGMHLLGVGAEVFERLLHHAK